MIFNQKRVKNPHFSQFNENVMKQIMGCGSEILRHGLALADYSLLFIVYAVLWGKIMHVSYQKVFKRLENYRYYVVYLYLGSGCVSYVLENMVIYDVC